MDAIVFIILSLIITLKLGSASDQTELLDNEENVYVEDPERVAKLNDTYFEDANAFSEMINELGFPKET